ncbi:E3 ubiquitin-protein ligase HUWE1-like [Acanthaster planci]|uniref:HECT-type E3 ubiquitin transferase n=1 Tax=Acanthaster planci TaxID=133434 RepID=A0A8B7XJH5_ACAPL|nr:E3 ubiquitin-protein ligase HUWE1-like [Acanthaster planci]
MKVDRSKLKKSSSEVPSDCKALIEKLKSCADLSAELAHINTWNHGKCELFHWVDVLDRFDSVLEDGCRTTPDCPWHLALDLPGHAPLKQLVHSVLNFTALLIEHSFSRHLYNSIEHLTTLLSSSDLNTVLAVLNLVYVFSKRSNFLIKLAAEKRQELFSRLTYLAESWGGKDNGFGLAECCQNGPKPRVPTSATTLHFEFYSELVTPEDRPAKKHTPHAVTVIHLENVDRIAASPAEIMEDLMKNYNVPKEKQMLLFTHIRLAHCFATHDKRMQCVQARLQALSVLVYSSAIQEVSNSLLYSGLVEELVDVLELDDLRLVDIKAASLRTLTSIIHLDRNPKLVNIIDATGASSYHGFLPVLVRRCIQAMIDPTMEAFPHALATALFSFLYHLASYETGGEALVSCGMMESLLKVIKWPGEDEQIHTTFVTRAVRVVDLITNLDMAAFQTHQGLSTFINRLEHEVAICRKQAPFVLRPSISGDHDGSYSPAHYAEDSMELDSVDGGGGGVSGSKEEGAGGSGPKDKKRKTDGAQCFPQRAALLKSMLNFLKKAIPDPAFSDSIRHVMDGTLPSSLKHIISNAEYYGPSLFLLACELVTVYVFQEPSLLSSLQDTGLTDVMLHALLIKDVPATKEVLGSLPNIFSALCLNARGLNAFVQCKPFDKLFKVLLSPTYLPAMKRRRSNDALGDTASSLGSAMDELMRHQPLLKADAMKAIIKLLEEICVLGRDPKYTCSRTPSKTKVQEGGGGAGNGAPSGNLDGDAGNDTSSDDEEDEDEIASTMSQTSALKTEAEMQPSLGPEVKTPIPLLDYILNVMKFVEAILSNNATDDHCREFVNQKGLVPLMGILGLPNMPIDFPSNPACQAVAGVCKSVLSLAHETSVLKQGLLYLNDVLQSLEPLHHPLGAPGGSVLLRELVNTPNISEAPQSAQATPLLHAMASAHAYVTMFVHVCRVGQSDVRTISVNQWGSDLGQSVLRGLSKLYTSLVWESIVLLALFTPGALPEGCDLGKAEKEKLLPKEIQVLVDDASKPSRKSEDSKSEDSKTEDPKSEDPEGAPRTGELDAGIAGSSLMDVSDMALSPMEVEDSTKPEGKDSRGAGTKPKMSQQMLRQLRQAMPVLYAPSRLGKALSELFGLLVKLCVGSAGRQRSRQQLQPNVNSPSEAARNTAKALTDLLASSLSWTPPPACPLPKFRLTFYICAVSFASSMLFDEKKNPYHLMLQKFMTSGAHTAVFEAFNWALSMGGKVPTSEGLEHAELPEGTGEFLDVWLVLIEKLVNPEAVLDSPHSLPARASPGRAAHAPFSPAQFLISTHKAAFGAVASLWERRPLKVYGGRMSESLLAILCHILRGEAVVRERLEKEKADEAAAAAVAAAGEAASGSSAGGSSVSGGGPSSSSSALVSSRLLGDSGLFDASGLLGRSRPRAEPNEEHVQQLIDMGFSRDHAREALQHTTSLEQAAEWALTHPPSITAGFGTGLSEEEEMMRAIAMSLGESIQMPSDQEEEERKKKEEDERAKKEQEAAKEKERLASDRIPEEPPLDKSLLDEFVNNMLPGCFKLLDELPDTVYRICDLLVVANNRDGEPWRKRMLKSLVIEIAENSKLLLETACPAPQHLFGMGSSVDGAWATDRATKLATSPPAAKLAPRLHLLCLLFEEMKGVSAQAVDESGVLRVLVSLLEESQKCMCSVKECATPKWLGPLLLLIDQFEKAAVTARRKLAQKGATHIWKWFDDSTGRWCTYSSANNKTIDDAYWAGKPIVRFTAARRRYMVHFSTMVQLNEETFNRRPVMQTLPSKEQAKDTDRDGKEDKRRDSAKKLKTSRPTEGVGSASVSTEDKPATAREPEVVAIQGLDMDHIITIIRSCVGLISLPVEPDTLHAVMRVCLRFTRNHQVALLFAELGGPRMLLSLKTSSSFNGFSYLATILIRHVFEERAVLRHAMDKLMTSIGNRGIGCPVCGVLQGSIGSRELHYVLRKLGPLACRDEGVFDETARSILRIALPVPKRGDEDESRYTGPNALQLLKALPMKPYTHPAMTDLMKQVLCDLLNALTAPSEPSPPPTAAATEASSQGGTNDKKASSAAAATVNPPAEIGLGLREIGDELLQFYSGGRNLQGNRITTQRLDSGTDAANADEEHGAVLAYILDHLLPQCQTAGDKDCPALAQVLLASIASSNHSPEAQSILVTETKAALARALALPESSEKHVRVQSLTLLISVMIEACPPPGSAQQQQQGGGYGSKHHPSAMNNMIRLLLRKGLAVDLARVPHSLDLSSPNMAATVNSALKPLETLSRVVNQPSPGVGTGLGKAVLKPRAGIGRSSALEDVGHSRSVTGNSLQSGNSLAAMGELRGGVSRGNTGLLSQNLQDVINNTPTSQATAAMESRTELDDIMDELLERGREPTSILGETLIATGPERLGSLGSGFLDQAGDASQDEMVITMTDEGEEMDHAMEDAEMNNHHSNEEETADIDGDGDSVHDGDSAAESDSDDDSEDQRDEEECDEDCVECEEEDEEEEEEEEEEDEEEHEGSDMDMEYDYYDDLEESYFGVADRDEDLFIQLEDVFPGESYHHGSILGVPASIRTYQLPVAVHDDNANGPSIPAAPSAVTTHHPLLIRHADHTNLTHGFGSSSAAAAAGGARSHRPRGQRGHRHGQNPTQTVHIYHSGNARPPSVPTILRLLGLSSAADIVQLTSGGASTTSSSSQTRIYLADSADDPMMLGGRGGGGAGGYEGLYEDLYQDNLNEGYLAGSDPVSSVPTTYQRWDEEARLLDGASMHDCVQALKPDLIELLEKHRDEELAERREKRRKQAEEEAAKKAQEETEQAPKKRDAKKFLEELCKEEEDEEDEAGDKTAAEGNKEKEEKMEVTEGESQSEATTSSMPDASGSPTPADLTAGINELASSIAAAAVGLRTSSLVPGSQAASLTASGAPSLLSPDSSSFVSTATTMVPAISSMESLPVVPLATTDRSTGEVVTCSVPITTTDPQLVTVVASTATPPLSVMSMPSSQDPSTAASAGISSSSSSSNSGIAQGAAVVSTSSSSFARASTILASEPTFASLLAQDYPVPGASPSVPATTAGSSVSSQPPASSTSTLAVTEQTSSQGADTPPSDPSGSSDALGDIKLPEGVDPSFLAALPESIRQEVLREHLGIRHSQPPASFASSSSAGAGTSGSTLTVPTSSSAASAAAAATTTLDPNSSISQVNPEFLAALPLHIQEEVLAQERAEQQRLLASQQSATAAAAAASEPVDPAAFIQNLPPGLRQTVLADMDDSVLALLPQELAAEAQALRIDRVLRHRQLMQERLLRETGMLGAILQSSGLSSRLGQGGIYRLSVPRSTSGYSWSWGSGSRGLSTARSGSANTTTTASGGLAQFQGRQLVDLEALTCLLVLLFVNEPKLNTARLHRVLRNLSYHPSTRQWILQALLGILERTSGSPVKGTPMLQESRVTVGGSVPGGSDVDTGSRGDGRINQHQQQQPSWLSISMDAALGCRASVFQVQRGSSKKTSDRQGALVCIHPQAAPLVCRHVLETLVSLAKVFPHQFVPQRPKDLQKSASESGSGSSIKLGDTATPLSQSDSLTSNLSQTSTSGGKAGSSSSSSRLEAEFWDLLVRLDNTSLGRKGKMTSKSSGSALDKDGKRGADTAHSPMAVLMGMLAHPVVRRSTALTDKMLHLLSLVSASLPETDKRDKIDQSTIKSIARLSRQTAEPAQPCTPAQSRHDSVSDGTVTPSITDSASGERQQAPSTTSSAGSPMDTASITDVSDTQELEADKREEKQAAEAAEKTIIEERLLKLAVDVLTAHSCSEDGLEDATTLLMQLSRGHGFTRQTVLALLLEGAKEIGYALCSDIKKLLAEVHQYQETSELNSEDEASTSAGASSGHAAAGTLRDRFNPSTSVVVSAATRRPGNAKRSGFELRLPSMALFTAKMSNQNLFLRMLKVVVQLKEAAKKAARKASALSKSLSGTASHLAAAVAALEANASEHMEAMNRRGQAAVRTSQDAIVTTSPVTGTSTPTTTAAAAASGVTSTPTPASLPQQQSGVAAAGQTSGSSSSSSRTASGGSAAAETPMEVDQPTLTSVQQGVAALKQASLDMQGAGSSKADEPEDNEPRLSSQLALDELWDTLSACLTDLSQTPDHHSVLVLQPAVEAFFLVHASEKDGARDALAGGKPPLARDGSLSQPVPDSAPLSPMPLSAGGLTTSGAGSFFARESSVTSIVTTNMPLDTQKFLSFAEMHRNVLNQILRQSTVHLSEGPFSVLVNHVRILDFDVKRRYFRQELERLDEGARREDMAVHVRREHVFEDSYRELHRRSPEEWKNRFYVLFEGEEGQDAGGLLREWYLIISKEIFNPMYALFKVSPGDRVTYLPNPASHCNSNHLSYFKFVGRIIAKAIYDNKLLDCYFSRSYYKHILGKPVKYTDMESEDYSFYQGLVFLLEHSVTELGYELTFSTEIEEFGVTEIRDLKPNGRNIPVTAENKLEYVHLVCQMKMTGAIRKQLDSFLEGFYDIIPKRLISIFNEQELELLISGLPTIDVDDLKANTEYHKYQANSLQIQWFWRALRSFDQAIRAKFLQFVTGTSKVPLQGFASLEGMNGPQKFQIHRDDRSTDRLPTAHTCFNQLDLPAYETYDKLRKMLLLAIEECTEGFGLA